MTNLPAIHWIFEVNTYDAEGNALLRIGQFSSVDTARKAIARHCGATLDPRTRLASQLPCIV